MRPPSPSRGVAWLIAIPAGVAMAAHLVLNRRVMILVGWLKADRPLDRPLPWLIGLMLAVLLIWLVHDARR